VAHCNPPSQSLLGKLPAKSRRNHDWLPHNYSPLLKSGSVDPQLALDEKTGDVQVGGLTPGLLLRRNSPANSVSETQAKLPAVRLIGRAKPSVPAAWVPALPLALTTIDLRTLYSAS